MRDRCLQLASIRVEGHSDVISVAGSTCDRFSSTVIFSCIENANETGLSAGVVVCLYDGCVRYVYVNNGTMAHRALVVAPVAQGRLIGIFITPHNITLTHRLVLLACLTARLAS